MPLLLLQHSEDVDRCQRVRLGTLGLCRGWAVGIDMGAPRPLTVNISPPCRPFHILPADFLIINGTVVVYVYETEETALGEGLFLKNSGRFRSVGWSAGATRTCGLCHHYVRDLQTRQNLVAIVAVCPFYGIAKCTTRDRGFGSAVCGISCKKV